MQFAGNSSGKQGAVSVSYTHLTLDEGQLMVAGNRGFMPVERIGTFWNINPAAKRLPLLRDGKQIQRNYCAFWKVKNSNYYIEEFANELKVQLNKN